eukprot:6749060-Prymnesium_polylepis.1
MYGVLLPTCAEEVVTDLSGMSRAICGTLAKCLDQPISASDSTTSPVCLCTGVTYADPDSGGTFGPQLEPYTQGCLTPLNLAEVTYKSYKVEVDLTKTQDSVPTEVDNITT